MSKKVRLGRGDRVVHANTGRRGTVLWRTSQTKHADGHVSESSFVVVDLEGLGKRIVYEGYLAPAPDEEGKDGHEE